MRVLLLRAWASMLTLVLWLLGDEDDDCPACGSKLRHGAKRCARCGTRMTWEKGNPCAVEDAE